MLLVIWDCSGSMGEMGKMALTRNLIAHLAESVRLGLGAASGMRLRILLWGTDVSAVNVLPSDDIPMPKANGQASFAELIKVLDSETKVSGEMLIVMFSDGCIGANDITLWRQWVANRPVNLRAVAVGPDADSNMLENLCGKGKTFGADKIADALDFPPSRDTFNFHQRIGLRDIAGLSLDQSGAVQISVDDLQNHRQCVGTECPPS